MRKAILLIVFFPFIPTQAAAWIFGPSSEADCRGDYVVVAKTEDAAKAAAYACRYLFTEKPETDSGIRVWKRKKRWANCVLDDVLSVETSLGAKQLSKICSDKAQ
ncbi:hypothetical protein ACFORG_14875 [Lutimaribacter marinistellae]|uniref:HdeA/HdeB family protein n=1 Tax=Lutimaribacter marinistellae TaxID=1820329 RepID=A0ABV7TJI8_9RHOB